MKRRRQDTNRAGTQEDMEETQAAGREPIQEAETGDNTGVQGDDEVEPALLHRAESDKNNKVESVKEI